MKALFLAATLLAAPLSAKADDLPDWEAGTDGSEDDAASLPADVASESAASEDLAPAPLSLDARLAALDGYLEEIEAPTRRYFRTWVAIQSTLVVGQAVIAFASDDKAFRGSYLIGAGVSAASLGLFLLAPRPGIRATLRYRDMASRTDSEKQAKLSAGEADLADQAEVDRRSTAWSRHLLGVGVALGSGAAVALIYEHSLKLAAQRVFLTFFVSELQILSRPRQALRNFERHFGRKPGAELAFAPLIDRHTQGVSLSARF